MGDELRTYWFSSYDTGDDADYFGFSSYEDACDDYDENVGIYGDRFPIGTAFEVVEVPGGVLNDATDSLWDRTPAEVVVHLRHVRRH